jgi:tetratricopeptide (TPR) repeat protein
MAYHDEPPVDLPCTFSTYLAAGDRYVSTKDFQKALLEYDKALHAKPSDKNCLIARGKCHLLNGDPTSALDDADSCIRDDKTFHRGLLLKAEALYLMGEFEHALMFYHRGQKLRPETEDFRLGIQKCQEAIDNSVGGPEVIQLDVESRKKSASKQRATKKATRSNLGEMYDDRKFLEKLAKDSALMKDHSGKNSVGELINQGIRYLDDRADFWTQQKPEYTRSRERTMLKPLPVELIKTDLSAAIKLLDDKEYEESLKAVIDINTNVETHPDVNKGPMMCALQADINSVYGQALLALGKNEESITRHKKELAAAKKSGITDLKVRAMDNLAEAYVKNQNYKHAMNIYQDRLGNSTSEGEKAWHYHNWARCLLEEGLYEKALQIAIQARDTAQKADDKVWELNSQIIVAQSFLKQTNIDEAEDAYVMALAIAEDNNDDQCKAAINEQLNAIKAYRKAHPTAPAVSGLPAEENALQEADSGLSQETSTEEKETPDETPSVPLPASEELEAN